MAGLLFHIPSGEIALSAATAQTLLEVLAAANHRAKVLGINFFGKGVSTTGTPIKIDIARITTTGTGTAGTTIKNNADDGETIQTTFEFDHSVEPTYGAILQTWEVHPQTGMILHFPLGQEVIINGGDLLGVRATAAEAVTCTCNLLMEE